MWVGLFIKSIETCVTELSGTGHGILEWCQIGTFDFTEVVDNIRLKQEIVYQIVRFISQVSLKLHMHFWKYFQYGFAHCN